MRNRRLVAIDLGAAYTKIAVRRDWDAEAALLKHLPLATKADGLCVPSVVARVKRRDRVRWVIGAEAAAQRPSEHVAVYEDWKAELFATHGARPVPPPGVEEIALRFLVGLRQMFNEVDSEIATWPVRICIPQLGDRDVGLRLLELAAEAGFEVAHGRGTVFEPESNTWGVLTAGRNTTWRPLAIDFQPRVERAPDLEVMLESDVIASLQRLKGMYGVLVTDVGAFTTDFGYVCFDASFRRKRWQQADVVQHSEILGIRELDQMLRGAVAPEVALAIGRLSAADWDGRKAKLYAGQAVAFRHSDGGLLYLGREDADLVGSMVMRFARRISRERTEFCRRSGIVHIDREIITGGGAMISGIRGVLRKRGDRKYSGHAEVRSRQRIGESGRVARVEQELFRGGSAIGACSVVLE